MNNSQQAKNGLKTFLITVAISLVVFTGLYYLITGSNNEEEVTLEEQTTEVEPEQVTANVQETTTGDPETSVFESLSEEEVEVEEADLAYVDESSEESVVNNENVLGTDDFNSEITESNTEDEVETIDETEQVAMEDESESTAEVMETNEEPEVLASAETTPIGGINQKSEVLAESSQSTVPNTGSTEITIALLLASVILTVGGYMISRNPNKVALAEFENRVTRKLD